MRKISNLGGLILAGGQARRLGGGDKPLLNLAGRAILDWQIESLKSQKTNQSDGLPPLSYTLTLALNANANPARFAGYALPILADGEEAYSGPHIGSHSGPLAGILAGLKWADERGFEALLTVPGDCPFLPQDLLSRLLVEHKASQKAAICARSDGQEHFLTCLWDVSALRTVQSMLEAGEKRAEAVLHALGYHAVEWPHLPYDPFLNINTPEDVTRAEQIAQTYFYKKDRIMALARKPAVKPPPPQGL